MKKNSMFLVALISLLLIIISCENTTEPDPEPNNETILAENSEIIDSNTNNLVASYDSTGVIVFNQTNSEISNFEEGDIIIGGISTNTPYGFLRKIDSIEDGLVFHTSESTLEDAYEELHFNYSKQLKVEDLESEPQCNDGVVFKKNLSRNGEFYFEIDKTIYQNGDDKIEITGLIEISPSYEFDIDISFFNLEYLRFLNTTTVTNEIEVSCTSEFYGIDETHEIASMPFTPIVISGVVIYPVITVDLHGEVTVEAEFSTGVDQVTIFETGLEYNDESWENLSSLDINFPEFIEPNVTFNASVKASTGPQMNLLLYGIAGPYVDANLFAEGTISLNANPWWKIEGGIECGAGVQVRIIGRTITDYYQPAIIGYSTIIAQASDVLQGTLRGIVNDAVTGNYLNNVNITAKIDNDIIQQDYTDSNGQYEIELPVNTDYTIIFEKDGYQDVQYENVIIEGNAETNLEPIMQIDDGHSGLGNISGTIYNALSGSPINSVNIQLRFGMNVQEGSILYQTTTDGSGNYSLNDVEAGNYTIEATKNGYNNSYFNVFCIGGETSSNQNGIITPIMNEDEIRIVLTWGQYPSDLDSHLTGPIPESDNRFHVFYGDREFNYNGETYAELDTDDVTSWGPETITIYNQTDGLYRYSIYDYSNGGSTTSYALSNSNAQVRVYKGSELLQSYNVPSNTIGTLWTVFEMHDDVINNINEMSNGYDFRGETNYKNLPKK